jgi:predicted RNA binding protein YcfA (HicA-like mRNA interferase family)
MSPKIPAISGAEAIRKLARLGFVVRRQRGSHVVLQKDHIVLSVPLHRTLKTGTLHDILKQSGVSLEEFREV